MPGGFGAMPQAASCMPQAASCNTAGGILKIKNPACPYLR